MLRIPRIKLNLNVDQWPALVSGAATLAVGGVYAEGAVSGRGLHSSTSELNLGRV